MPYFSFSQSIQVLDSLSSSPISDVRIISSNGSTSSNEEGFFELSNFSPSDIISFEHISYKNVLLPFSVLLRKRIVYLSHKVFEEDTILILGKQSKRNTINISTDDLNRFNNAGELLSAKTKLNIKDYGKGNSFTSVSYRGLSSENTLILLNGIVLNDISSNSFNLSNISLRNISDISISENASFISPLISAGGKINLNPAKSDIKNQIDLYMGTGSNSTHNFGSEIIHNFNGLKAILNFDRSYSRNNYDFRFEDNNFSRKNSDYSKTNSSMQLLYSNKFAKLNFWSSYSSLNHGLPGFVVSNNTNSSSARNKVTQFISMLQTEIIITNNLKLKNSFSFNSQKYSLIDPKNSLLIFSNESTANSTEYGLASKLDYQSRNYIVTTGLNLNFGSLNSIGSYIQPQNNNLYFEKLNLISWLGFESSFSLNNPVTKLISYGGFVNYQYDKTDYAESSTQNNLSYSGFLASSFTFLPDLSIKYNISSSKRFISFNEWFYAQLFSKNKLKNEQYFNHNLSLEYAGNQFNFAVSFFLIDVQNRILWVPTRLGLQSPMNIGNSKSTGFDFDINYEVIPSFWKLNINYIFTAAINKSARSENDFSKSKQLIYTPKHKLNIGSSLRWGDFSINWNSQLISERFITSDNNPRFAIPLYTVTDLTFNYSKQFYSINHNFLFSILNLFNESYLVIQSFPMPLRTYSFTYQMEF